MDKIFVAVQKARLATKDGDESDDLFTGMSQSGILKVNFKI